MNFKRFIALLILLAASDALMGFEREDYEEEAGASSSFLLNPSDDVYGIGLGGGTWLKGTPVFGDYSVRLFRNGIEDAFYGGIGLTIRIMPHWMLAPFAGAGGSYSHSLSRGASEKSARMFSSAGEEAERGRSYWAVEVETGFRFWCGGRLGFLELNFRRLWPSLEDGRHGYWLIGIGMRPGI
ncbi:MAG: hypothetical protein N2255_00280 [Kiritimatiellae bacterium]|nr:hypothetical protein [Kiritimatiellia bacterium]